MTGVPWQLAISAFIAGFCAVAGFRGAVFRFLRWLAGAYLVVVALVFLVDPGEMNDRGGVTVVVAIGVGAVAGYLLSRAIRFQRPPRWLLVTDYVVVVLAYTGGVAFLTWLKPNLVLIPYAFRALDWGMDPYDNEGQEPPDLTVPEPWTAEWFWVQALFVVPVSLLIAQVTTAAAFSALRAAGAGEYQVRRTRRFQLATLPVLLALAVTVVMWENPAGVLAQLAVLVWCWWRVPASEPSTLLEFGRTCVATLRTGGGRNQHTR